MIETLKTTKTLVKEGFKVLVYCTDDPLHAKKLEDLGASSYNAALAAQLALVWEYTIR